MAENFGSAEHIWMRCVVQPKEKDAIFSNLY